MSMLRKTTEFLSLYHVSFLIFHWNYKQNECPEPEPGCDFEAVEEAKELWKTLKVTPQAPQVFTIQMEQIAPFGKKMSTLLCIFFHSLQRRKLNLAVETPKFNFQIQQPKSCRVEKNSSLIPFKTKT